MRWWRFLTGVWARFWPRPERDGNHQAGALSSNKAPVGGCRDGSSGKDVVDRLAVVDVEPLEAGDLKLSGVEAELVQDGGVDVGDVVSVLDGVETELVGCAMNDAPLDTAAGHPGGEAEGVVVAAVAVLRAGGAAELGRPDNEGVIEQATTLEIL